MFAKRKLTKVDLLEGIQDVQQKDQNQVPVVKKVKPNNKIVGNQPTIYNEEEIQKFKATYILNEDQQNRFAVEVEKPKRNDDERNPVIQTIQKFMAIKTLDQIDPKKHLPKIDQSAQEEYQKTKKSGPIIAPANVKFSCRFDYNPSLCKDYHDTGYCTFGDSCIYGHDRGDYKTGWEVDKEWEEAQKKRQLRLIKGDISDNDADELAEALSQYPLPEYCPLCSELLNKPVMTKCEHIFCEACALQRYKEDPKCSICNKQTNGIFQEAKKQIKKIQDRRYQIEKEHKERTKKPKKNYNQ